MTTTRIEPRTEQGSGSGYAKCDGCPRCQDQNAGTCPYNHVEFNGRHPVCKACGHCVLRGKHKDDASDLDQYRNNIRGGFPSIHRN